VSAAAGEVTRKSDNAQIREIDRALSCNAATTLLKFIFIGIISYK
jgi:hypothetical protein